MRFLNGYLQVSILLLLGTVLACGNSRNGRVTGQRNNKTIEANSKIQGSHILFSFIAKVAEVKKNSKAGKPTPETGFLLITKEILRAYDAAISTDKKQASANESLESTFGIISIIPKLTEAKDKILVEAHSKSGFVFSGEVDKATQRGDLKADTVPESHLEEDKSKNANSNVVEESIEEQPDSNGVRPKKSVRVPINKPPIDQGPRFSAKVVCVDSNCELLVANFIDKKVGFYPVLVRTQLLPNEGQNINLGMLSPLAGDLKSTLTQNGIKVTENNGEVIWSAEMTDSNFQIESQSRLFLPIRQLSTYFALRRSNGESEAYKVQREKLDISENNLRDVVISLNPKK
ncbi:MAG: hypothetical protein A4S09_08030 [Proteobacteria bacterium SG_bin7]|nr:MAG: hypothetical protein A4S09_08030 [Proteobacteria bacterium SG_bin7]